MSRFVVRWPHQGDKANPLGDEGQWLEDTASGEVVYGHQGEPEDMCLGRDLDVFVDSLNGVDAERQRAIARAEKAEAERDEARAIVDEIRPLLDMASSIKTAFENGHHAVCVYCGEKVDGGLLTDRAAVVASWKAHSEVCTKSVLGQTRAALKQVTEQHDKLVAELAEQYREAERVGWLPPDKVKKLRAELETARAEHTVHIDGVAEAKKLLTAADGPERFTDPDGRVLVRGDDHRYRWNGEYER